MTVVCAPLSVYFTWCWIDVRWCVLCEVAWQVTLQMSITFRVYNVYLAYVCFCWHFKGSCSWLADEEACYGSTYQSEQSESTKSKRQKLQVWCGVVYNIRYLVRTLPYWRKTWISGKSAKFEFNASLDCYKPSLNSLIFKFVKFILWAKLLHKILCIPSFPSRECICRDRILVWKYWPFPLTTSQTGP